jgi:hypothetical protein
MANNMKTPGGRASDLSTNASTLIHLYWHAHQIRELAEAVPVAQE